MKISIITPTFNQGTYIERTIQSILSQKGDFELEYIVIDGGSTDNTLDILRKYESLLSWKSEPDDGQSDAIDKGFKMATGDILAWLNSDDTYFPQALNQVVREYMKTPFTWCFGNCKTVDEFDKEKRHLLTGYKIWQSRRYSYQRLLRRDFIPQPAVFFSKEAFKEIGELNRSLEYSMDYDYWLRLGQKCPPVYIDNYLANFRWHKTSKNGSQYKEAAWETYLTSKQYAPKNAWLDIFMHYLHYHALKILYRFI